MDADIQLRDNHTVNVRIFDTTAALDDTISDMARGLLFRVRALAYMHVEMYGAFANLTLEQLASGSPDGIEAIRACLRELFDRGYVRRWKEDDRWIVELSVVPVSSEPVIPVLDHPPVKKTRKPRSSNKRSPMPRAMGKSGPKLNVHPAYRKAIAVWLEAPDGGDYMVTTREWSRVMMSINTILELALKRGWIDSTEHQDGLFEEEDTHELLAMIADCWEWIKKSEYRGNQDIHNVAKRMQDWWNQEGKRKYNKQSDNNTYTPMMI